MLFMRYFNPRSREGSDPTAVFLLHFPSISIHAPARGATYSPHEIKERLQINFNPRSREGSDTIRSHFPSFCCHFNPRSREGSDRRSPCLFRTRSRFQSTLPRGERPFSGSDSILCGNISIHAPARGATKEKSAPARISSFQSTLPRGERPVWQPWAQLLAMDFNPRSREGSDLSSPAV